MPKRTKIEAARSKIEAARELSEIGSVVAGPAGGVAGGLAGLIIGDQTTVFPMDMVAVPAFEFGMLAGDYRPSFMIFIKEGEVLTQVDDTPAMKAERLVELGAEAGPTPKMKQKRKRKSPYKKAYSKAFQEIKPEYLKANGQWKKGGFKRAVKRAHAMAKGGKK